MFPLSYLKVGCRPPYYLPINITFLYIDNLLANKDDILVDTSE